MASVDLDFHPSHLVFKIKLLYVVLTEEFHFGFSVCGTTLVRCSWLPMLTSQYGSLKPVFKHRQNRITTRVRGSRAKRYTNREEEKKITEIFFSETTNFKLRD